MGKYVRLGWLLEFYDVDNAFVAVGDLIPEAGDVLCRARANGAKDGTPYFLRPDGRADSRINRFWRAPSVRCLQDSTLRRYAFSLKVWLNFLDSYGVEWDNVSEHVLAAFKEWRMSAEEAGDHVAAGTFRIDLAALRRFYLWASRTYPGVETLVRTRIVGETLWGEPKEELEAKPSGVRKADVKWLSPDAYRRWRNIGLRGFTRDGVPAETWKGRTEDRDVAFADALFGTGLRCGELASLLLVELPDIGDRGLYRCTLAATCAKTAVSRSFWMPVKALQQTYFYVVEGSRSAAVARAQRACRYETIPDRWVLEGMGTDGRLTFRDLDGGLRVTRLDSLTPKRRRKLFRQTEAGLEPLALWLNHDGTPRRARSWNTSFERANARVLRVLGTGRRGVPSWAAGGAPLFARPHMLRHSFALRWFSILKFVEWQRTARLSESEQRDLREDLGGIWFLMSTLLGHASAETSKSVYLEPFQALEIEQLVALMEAEDRAALERLVDAVALGEPRVLSSRAGTA